jgi:hypothetical protein
MPESPNENDSFRFLLRNPGKNVKLEEKKRLICEGKRRTD